MACVCAWATKGTEEGVVGGWGQVFPQPLPASMHLAAHLYQEDALPAQNLPCSYKLMGQ